MTVLVNYFVKTKQREIVKRARNNMSIEKFKKANLRKTNWFVGVVLMLFLFMLVSPTVIRQACTSLIQTLFSRIYPFAEPMRKYKNLVKNLKIALEKIINSITDQTHANVKHTWSSSALSVRTNKNIYNAQTRKQIANKLHFFIILHFGILAS